MPDSPRPNARDQNRRQLPDEVAAYVRELIISGTMHPGEFVRMEPIAEAVGVSNTPVREGLLRLRSEGFLTLAPRRGFVVASFTRQDVRDLFWVQAELAGELAFRATRLISAEDLDRLEQINDEFLLSREGTNELGHTDLGIHFHVIINRAAQSHRLGLLLNSVANQLPMQFYATIEGQVTATHAEHPEILDALRRRQPAKVRKLMKEHIEGMADHLIATLERRGVWTDSEAQ